jgi:hypothetical protein
MVFEFARSAFQESKEVCCPHNAPEPKHDDEWHGVRTIKDNLLNAHQPSQHRLDNGTDFTAVV